MSINCPNAEWDGGRVIALAGRRVADAQAGDDGEFLLTHITSVAERLRTVFTELRADTLCCSAANGADIVALCVARELGIRFRIVLPFDVRHFREVSVVDRPGDELWGWLYDGLVAEARSRANLILLGLSSDDPESFDAANARIVDEAVHFSQSRVDQPQQADNDDLLAVGIAVWNGLSYGDGDRTASFCNLLRSRQIHVMKISIDEQLDDQESLL